MDYEYQVKELEKKIEQLVDSGWEIHPDQRYAYARDPNGQVEWAEWEELLGNPRLPKWLAELHPEVVFI